MGCGILYRMVAERIGLSATLATHRTGSLDYGAWIMSDSQDTGHLWCQIQ